jgi:dTMP kinase
MADPPRHPYSGLFLVLDGPDGSGKTTQAARLASWLASRGYDVVSCRDPGGTALGERIRTMLLDGGDVPMALRAEMLLFMASRAQLVEEVIAPALDAGKTVVSARFLLANIVYQGTAGGLLEEEIALVGMAATRGVLPDLTIVLDIAPAQAQARMGAARDRIEERPLLYHERVRAGFLAAASGLADDRAATCPFYPAPVALVDASADRDTVFAKIQGEVERVLAQRPRP